MPTEMRRIVFSNEELLNAINFINSRDIPKLQDGIILSSSVDAETRENIIIVFSSFNRDETRNVSIAIPTLGAALINYCIKNNIPMSKKAGKSIKIIGDNVSLELTFGSDIVSI
jgi:hypothetical protein